VELASTADAKVEAVRYAREVAGCDAADGVLDLSHAIEAHDQMASL
jgi:hypothetical protein